MMPKVFFALCLGQTISFVHGAFLIEPKSKPVRNHYASSCDATTAFVANKRIGNVRLTSLWYANGPHQKQENTMDPSSVNVPIPSKFTSPVLEKVAPALIEYKAEYGHPNIPLGSPEGRQCVVLRRLHIQNVLSEEEVAWLESIGFMWHSLEDVVHDLDFDTMLQRLLDYESRHPNSNFQVPKKCPEDPELGAWVTGLRRLYNRDETSKAVTESSSYAKDLDPNHVERLNEVGFVWQSTRKCGSKFMKQYRSIKERVESEGLDSVLTDSKVCKWIVAQQQVNAKGSLSNTRIHYLDQLLGSSWMETNYITAN